MEDLSIQPQDQSISVLEKVVVGKDNNYYYWYKAPQFRLMIYWYKAPQLRLMIYWYNAPQLRQKQKISFYLKKLIIQIK